MKNTIEITKESKDPNLNNLSSKLLKEQRSKTLIIFCGLSIGWTKIWMEKSTLFNL